MRCMPRGVEAVHGRARLSCHRWITAASVMASATHPRAHLSTLLTASRCTRRGWVDGAVARWYMARTSGALHATRRGGAPWSCPTVLPSVDHGCKRDGFSYTPTCAPQHTAYGLSMHTSWLGGWCCSAIVYGQDEWCAACHAVWRRTMVMPDCPAIGGPRLQA